MNVPPPSANQARILWLSLTSLAAAVLLGLMILLVWTVGWLLRELSAVLLPALIALILAYILDPVVEFFIRKKVPRVWAIVLVFALGLLLLGAVLGSVVPGLIRETGRLINNLPKDSVTLRMKVDGFLENSAIGRRLPAIWTFFSASVRPPTNSPAATAPPATNAPAPASIEPPAESDNGNGVQTNSTISDGQTEPWMQVANSSFTGLVVPHLTDLLTTLSKWLLSQLSKVTTWAEFVLGFVLIPLFLFYLLKEKQAISSRWTDYLPIQESRAKEELVFVLKAINDCLIVFFRGQVLVALCVGMLLTIGYLSLGLNYAVLLGLVAATLGIVPYAGALITLVLALIVATVQFGDWTHPLLVLGIAAVVKMLEDYVISPKIIGKRAGLHPLTIILAVLVGTTVIGGVLGALFAIPVTAVLRTLMFRYIWKKPSAGLADAPQEKPAGSEA